MNALLLSLITGVAAGAVPSPPGYPPPPPPSYPAPVYNYNYDRAYRQFLNSPSGLKTFSSLGQGSGADTFTPFSHQSFYRSPSYEHQRIDESGWDRYNWVPGYGGSFDTPFYGSGYRVPGYGIASHMPPLYPPRLP